MMKWVGILGTWAYKPGDPRREWFQDGSTFSESLKRYGLEPARPEDDFVWSGDLDGTFFAHGNDWEAGAHNLAHYLRSLPFEDRNLIAHSHGGAVALFAALRVPIRSLVTISTPARKAVRQAGRDAIQTTLLGAWGHVLDDRWDTFGAGGALFDGDVRLTWRWPFIDRSMAVPGCKEWRLKGVGHSRLLDGLHTERMEREGILDVLRKGAV